MGYELRYVCLLVKTRRLLLLIGFVFGLILFVQYFELPYVNVLSSVFETSKYQVATIDIVPSRGSLSNPVVSRNLTRFSRNSTDLNVANEVPTTMEASDGNDDTRNAEDEFVVGSGKTLNDTLGDDFGLEKGKSLNDISGSDFSLENGKTLNDTLDDGIDPDDEIPLKDSLEMDRDSTIETALRNYIGETGGLQESDVTSKTSASLNHDGIGNVVQRTERNEDRISKGETPSVAQSPSSLLSHFLPPQNPDSSRITSTETSLPYVNIQLSTYVNNSASSRTPKLTRIKGQPPTVVTISEMNDLLSKSRVSNHSVKAQWPSQADKELLNAKKLIENADSINKNYRIDVNVYRNFSAFTRSYELMEQTLKIYIYTEGERPIFHQPELNGIYASEGWFMKQLEENKHFVTKNANKAHLFYLPFSSRVLQKALLDLDSHSRKILVRYLSSYLQNITTTHRFWNRTNGTDHFLVACHDSAPAVTSWIMNNCIKALCNANVKKGFQFSKDVSLPQTRMRNAMSPLKSLGGKPPSQRHILAFFAGQNHGYLRPILLNHWENKDPDMKIFSKLQKVKGQMTYTQYMKSSKYCISAKGYEAFSPRVVEAIFFECVPVILSDNYIPPFFETLNWESFAVFTLEKDIPNLKNILTSIPEKRYTEMQQRVKQVQKHFLWHDKPVKFDVFHMILHSLWYTRVHQIGA
ncbi:Exostosin family protein [Perilla frutescens var. hirtella]|uniref:Exostosin family protein n=1 Tax=Perilla frutescens var. hirtella TaxID=608512 RepID=A0AAD4P184_PERFH|nr:Exostosin family protein [Perilla frutescens var. hirtella]